MSSPGGSGLGEGGERPSPEPSELGPSTFFSAGQRRILAAALTLAATIAILAMLLFALRTLGDVVQAFAPLLWPLAVAGILALLLQPVVEGFQKVLHIRRWLASTLLYVLFVVVVSLLLLWLTPLLLTELRDFIGKFPELWQQATGFLGERFPTWIGAFEGLVPGQMVSERVPKWLEQAQEALLEAAPTPQAIGSQVLGVVGAITGAAIIPVYLFFFLQTSGDPTRWLAQNLPFLKPETRDDVVFLVREFIAIVVSFVRGQLVIGLIVGVILATGFSLVGLKLGLLIGLFMGVVNVVPYLGSILGLAVALPLALFQPDGGWILAGLVIVVFVVAQSLESWILTPKIMGDRTGLHPVMIIVAIFFWGIALGGILGLVLAIPLTAFFVTAWRLAEKKYIRPWA